MYCRECGSSITPELCPRNANEFCECCRAFIFGYYKASHEALAQLIRAIAIGRHPQRLAARFSDEQAALYEFEVKYKKLVSRLSLRNYEMNKKAINPLGKTIGRAGRDSGYQLDHIVPVSICFDYGIPPDVAAAMENMQVMPWRLNIIKNGYFDPRKMLNLPEWIRALLSRNRKQNRTPSEKAFVHAQTILSRVTKRLDLSQLTELEELPPELGSKVNLETIILNNTKIKTAANMTSLKKIRKLSVESTRVDSLSFLSGLEFLSDLNISNSNIEDIGEITKFKWLNSVSLRNLNVRDLRPMLELPQLRKVDLTGTKSESISAALRARNVQVLI